MPTMETTQQDRPNLTVYWVPGCSSCIKAKEFVASLGEPYEFINIMQNPEALAEVQAAGVRGAPAVRKGDRIFYAQSIDDLASFLGRSRGEQRLPRDVLVSRWSELQAKAREVIAGFGQEMLQGRRLEGPHADVGELAEHAFQVVESFLRLTEDDTIDARAIYLSPDPELKSREQILGYADRIAAEYEAWVDDGGPQSLPAKMTTHYGNQPADVVLERYVWHMAQHIRQLDHLLAGGDDSTLHVPATLYSGLPLPKALWS